MPSESGACVVFDSRGRLVHSRQPEGGSVYRFQGHHGVLARARLKRGMCRVGVLLSLYTYGDVGRLQNVVFLYQDSSSRILLRV